MAQLQKLMKSARKPQTCYFLFSLFLNPDAYFSAFKLFVPFIPFYPFLFLFDSKLNAHILLQTLFSSVTASFEHYMWVHSELFLNSPFFYIHLFSFLSNKNLFLRLQDQTKGSSKIRVRVCKPSKCALCNSTLPDRHTEKANSRQEARGETSLPFVPKHS